MSRWILTTVCAVMTGTGLYAIDFGIFKPATPTVPATQEIEVLDPGVSPTGQPKAVVSPMSNGLSRVDVPPTILVHKFYYTGDRTFQGPLLTGGSCIIVVNHPKTLERVYVPIVLPPGAPQVTYASRSIIYQFGPQKINIHFGICGQPTVTYSQTAAFVAKARDAMSSAASSVRDLTDRTGIPFGLKRFGEESKALVTRGADAVGAVFDQGIATPTANLLQQTPGASLLKPIKPEELAARQRERLERAAATINR